MFSKILIRLIDQSIVPAIILLTVRVLSVVYTAKYFNIPFTLGPQGFVYANANDYILVNSYSTLFMIITLAVGIFYILLKSLIFHETHISPNMTANLFSMRLSSFIQTSYDLYSQGSIWLSYLYLMTMSTGILALFGLIFSWVFYISIVLSILATVLLIFDIENELDLKSGKNVDVQEEFVLKFGGSE